MRRAAQKKDSAQAFCAASPGCFDGWLAAVTLATHAAKSTTRLTSTAATSGMTQFALSLAEDVVAVALAALLFFQPFFTVIVLVAILLLLLTHGSRVRHALSVLFFRIAHPRRMNDLKIED